MRVSATLFVLGEALGLAGIGMWSLPLAMVLLGIQLTALALFREQKTTRKPATRPASKPRHRSARSIFDRARRPNLTLVRKAAS